MFLVLFRELGRIGGFHGTCTPAVQLEGPGGRRELKTCGLGINDGVPVLDNSKPAPVLGCEPIIRAFMVLNLYPLSPHSRGFQLEARKASRPSGILRIL